MAKKTTGINVEEILNTAYNMGASDIFLVGGLPITYKVNGNFEKQGEKLDILTLEKLVKGLYEACGRKFSPPELVKDDDFSLTLPGLARFRCNVFYQRGTLSAVVRMLKFGIPSSIELEIPNEVLDVADVNKGLVLVTGTTGSGKSTTIACILDKINHLYEKNIITMEDPIEYLFRHDKSIIIQREIPTDTNSFATALRGALRECPDILFVGEMRDSETIATAMTAAETGRFVISTLHTISAADTIDRIIDSFPEGQQPQIRFQLSRVLRYVICQQLVPGLDGKLHPAFEILRINPAVQNLIREGKVHQIPSIMQTSREQGMRTMQSSLDEMVRAHIIDRKTASQHNDDVSQLIRLR